MESISRPVLKEIPGVPSMDTKSEYRLKNLTELNDAQLQDLVRRQKKLLDNQKTLKCLKDKGERVRKLYERVVEEVNRRSDVEEAAMLFSKLNFAEHGLKAVNALEWRGKSIDVENATDIDPSEEVLDSDDELEIDPLRFIALAQLHKQKVKVSKSEPTLITSEDLKEILEFQENSTDSSISPNDTVDNKGFSSSAHSSSRIIDAEVICVDLAQKLPEIKEKLKQNLETITKNANITKQKNSELEQHVQYLVEKTELTVKPKPETFKPFKTTVSNVHDPEKEHLRKRNKYWEVTAATPLPLKSKGTQMLNLLDSIDIQKKYLERVKILEEEQANERLLARMERLSQRQNIKLPTATDLMTKTAFTTYRQPASIEGDLEVQADAEMHDPLDTEEKGGGVNFSYTE